MWAWSHACQSRGPYGDFIWFEPLMSSTCAHVPQLGAAEHVHASEIDWIDYEVQWIGTKQKE